jgi:CspA family cold shock protein
MVTGTVKFYNRTKRFGFIAQDEGEDVFVHESGIVEGRLKAVNVKKIE